MVKRVLNSALMSVSCSVMLSSEFIPKKHYAQSNFLSHTNTIFWLEGYKVKWFVIQHCSAGPFNFSVFTFACTSD